MFLAGSVQSVEGEQYRRYAAGAYDVAGLDLFPAGAQIEESRTLWPFQGRQPRSLCNVGRTN